MQRHLGGDVGQPLLRKWVAPMRALIVPKGARPSRAGPHGIRIRVEPPLHLLDKVLVLPAGDPALLGGVHCRLIGQAAQAALDQ